MLSYGQSLSNGWEGWPALSRQPRTDALMLGRSVRPSHESASSWTPVGDADFRPLVATDQDIITGALLTGAEVAAGPPAGLGETVLESAVHTLRAELLSRAPDHRLVASACGVGGRSLEGLSSGAEPELFNRMRDCVELARIAAARHGWDYRLLAVLLLQGENNSWGLGGATSDGGDYKDLLRRWHADVAALAGAAAPVPTVFTYQTGGAYASASQSIAQAQLEAALELPGWYLAAPAYPVTDKGGHLDANGYRWLGAQFGKVMADVLVRDIAWRPLHPVGAVRDGHWIAVRFSVPVPPLRFGRPYWGHTAVDVPDHGFCVSDHAGEVAVQAVELTGPTSLLLTLARVPDDGCVLRYAAAGRTLGLGSLHDSDPRVAAEAYVYDPTTGHAPSANIPELVGRPYRLMNWCVGFSIPVPRATSPAGPG